MYYNTLSDLQKKYWNQLEKSKDIGLLLYGSTAISLQIGHRSADDFDFFTDEIISSEDMHKKILETIPFIGTAERTVIKDDMLVYKTEDNLQLSFFTGITTGRISAPVITDDKVLNLASLDDLFAYKVHKFPQRIRLTDFIDLAAILDFGLSLKKGLEDAKILFKDKFIPEDCIKVLEKTSISELIELSQKDKDIISSALLKL